MSFQIKRTARENVSQGLVLVKSLKVGTNVASVSVADVFSSLYDNYRILISGGSCTENSVLSLKLDGAINGYYQANLIWRYRMTAGDDPDVSGYQNEVDLWYGAGWAESSGTNGDIEVYGPYSSETTYLNSKYAWSDTVSGGHYESTGMCLNTLGTTGFVVFPSYGTLTDVNIRVYGYRN